MNEHRQFSRIDFNTKTYLIFQGQRVETNLVDISLKGALLALTEDIAIRQGENCALEIQLGGSDIVLNIQTELVHIEGRNLGFRFQSIDLDSLAHLRRLMEVNLGDTDLIDQELFFLSK
ncbi:MAG: PilZ domain-containing protein [SAR324 cluster bacterium]|nr:PilZ domain-containing protein [SAR324 cluster bacterium]